MEPILKKLNIRQNEKSIFFSFFLFNLVLYAGVFLGRAIRDALFFSKIGADYLPFVFIANAVSMSVFGTLFSKWTGGGYSLKKVLFVLFSISAACVFLFAVIFSLDLTGNVPLADLSLENVVIILFYWILEIPLFLMLVGIWIIAENYISESMGQRLNPKITGGGHIGIVIGGIIAVFVPSLFKLEMKNLTYILGGLVFFQAFMVLLIHKLCKKLPNEFGEEGTDEIEVAVKTSFLEDFKDSFKVIKKYKFSVYFALITLFNFFLFGINDYMLNKRAINAGISEDKLVFILGVFTIGFGILSAFFQFAFLTKIIKKLGIPKTNLGGAIIFVIGFAILLMTSTYMFEPFQKWLLQITGMEKAGLLLYCIALVRFGGYIAEYLFNQSMLPALYGAIPEEDRAKTRSFIEGTFVQMVFGLTGILLILYKPIFKDNLDLLILLGATAAVLMLVFSRLLISQYKYLITLGKQSFKDKIVSKIIGKIGKAKVQELFRKRNTFITTSLIESLSKNKRHEFSDEIFNQFDQKSIINVAVINGIIELNSLEYFEKLVNRFIEFEANTQKFVRFKQGDTKEIQALLSGFYKIPHNYDVFLVFDEIEKNQNCSVDQKKEIILFFSKLDNKNGIIKANKILEKLGDKKLAMKLSAEIGFDDYSGKIQQELSDLIKEDDESQFVRIKDLLDIIGKINYSNQKRQFDAFKIALDCMKIMEVRPFSSAVAKKMMKQNSFLVLIAVDYLSNEEKGLSLDELPDLLSEIPIVGEREIAYSRESLKEEFSVENIPIYNNHFSVNHLLEGYIRKGSPRLFLNSYRVLSQRMKNNIEVAYRIENAGFFFDNELRKLYLIWMVVEKFKGKNDSVYLLAQKRAEWYYKQCVLYSLLLHPDTDAFDMEQFYRNLTSGNRLLKDNSITLLEQSVPRDYFKKIDDYFYLDDEANPSKEIELSAKARELYGNEATLENALKLFNDDILNNLINKSSEVNHEKNK